MKTRQDGKIRLEAFSYCLNCELRNDCNRFCGKKLPVMKKGNPWFTDQTGALSTSCRYCLLSPL